VQWADHLFVEAPPFEQLSPERWQFVVRANLEGAYTAIQTVLPSMRSGQWGRVVNISAVVAADGVAGSAWYAAAKSALHGLTRSLSKEVGTDGILVNAVMPGLTMSDRTLAMVPEALRQTYALATPIGRLLDATEVAATVVFLASTANTAITGEIIRASGGFITPHRPHPNLRQRTDAISSSADARSSMLVGVKA
jgi:3-oxoacyl-[acyl-carrier protein] reductase